MDRGDRIDSKEDETFGNATISLYVSPDSIFTVHTYRKESAERIQKITEEMIKAGDMSRDENDKVSFSCGHRHQKAAKMIFTQVIRHRESSVQTEGEMMMMEDRKSGEIITIRADEGADGWVFTVRAHDKSEKMSKRINGIVRNFVFLLQMEQIEGTTDQVAFPCSQHHFELVKLSFPKALTRSPVKLKTEEAEREEQEMARGILTVGTSTQ